MQKKTPRILIVDDEPDLREILEDRFQSFQFETASAGSGNEAWAMLQSQDFDVVLSDIRMKDGDGLELLERIKARDVQKPAVFLMTGFHKDFSERELLDQGVDGFFSKPFDSAQARNAIQKAVIPSKERWGQQGRYVSEKTLSFKSEGLGVDFFPGRLGFSLNTKPPAANVGEILNFLITGAVELKGIGKLAWDHADQDGFRSIGIEILSLTSDCLDKYLTMIPNGKATIPISN